MTRRATLGSLLSIALIGAFIVALAPSASAYTITKKDTNDTKGPLDLASIRLDRDGSDMLFTFTTRQDFSNLDLGQRSYFALAFDIDLDGDADRCAFIYRPVRTLSGLFTNCGSHVYNNPSVSRKGHRAARILLSVESFKGSLRWAGLSFYERDDPCYRRGCVDAVPNRRSVFFDLEPPTASWITTLSGRHSSMQLSTTTTVPLQFDLEDERAGSIDFTIERNVANVWTPIATGSGTGATSYDLEAEQGQTYYLRLRGMDAAGNESLQPGLTVNVPYDDTNPGAAYSADWSTQTGLGYFMGGAHVTATTGAVMTFTFTGTHLYLLGGPGDGTAQFFEEGHAGWIVTETAATPPGQELAGLVWGPAVPRTVTVEVTSGTFVIDGFGIEP